MYPGKKPIITVLLTTVISKLVKRGILKNLKMK